MPEYLTPGLYFETVDSDQGGISAIRTDIAALIGIAERGPLHTPRPVSSWAQFQAIFGDMIAGGYLAYTAKAFFENGGRRCQIVRVAAGPAGTVIDPAALQPADGAASIVLAVAGFVPGAVVTVRQAGPVQADHLLRDVDVAARRLIWDQPLGPAFALNDPLKPLSFETGAAPAWGELLDATGAPTLRLEASSPGVWGNQLSVRVARNSPAATRTSALAQPADRLSSLVASIAGFGAGALVRIYQDQAPAPLEIYRLVTGVDPARGRLIWDVALDLAFDLTQPITFETLEFALAVYRRGRLHENFAGLSLVPGHARYIANVITAATAQLIRVVVLEPATPLPQRLPDPAAPNLRRGGLGLRAGRDGLAGLRPLDFTGDPTLDQLWGLRALEPIDEVAIVAMPDILIRPTPPVLSAPLPVIPPDPCLPGASPEPEIGPPEPLPAEQPPAFTPDEIFAAQQALIAHCEGRHDRVALLDAPLEPARPAVLDLGAIQGWRQRFDSSYAALYYPWVLVYDPLRLGGQVVRAIPPCGHVAGIFARTDLEVGVHKAPANVELRWAQAISVEVSAEEQGLLNPLGINCLRTFAGRGLRLYGARTASSDANWRYVNVRRLLMMIEEAIEEAVQWAVFEPNDFYLRQALTQAISGFLEAIWQRGALSGATAEQAFFVKCDEDNNPPALAALGQLVTEVGVAPSIPAEFVIFRIGHTEEELELVELGAGSQSSSQ